MPFRSLLNGRAFVVCWHLNVIACFHQPSWNPVEIRVKVLGVENAIKYFSFWDVPRSFALEPGGKVYVLASAFDDDLDAYPDDYEVFVVSAIGNLSVVSDWKSIEPLPKTSVGRVPVASVRFD